MRLLSQLIGTIAITACVAIAQSLVGTQRVPAAVTVLPGMIVTFQIPGLELRLDEPMVIRERPLPFQIFDVSLQLKSRETGKVFPVAIFAIRQIDDCPVDASQPRCRTTYVTAHIPPNLEPIPYPNYYRDSSGTDNLRREDSTFTLDVTEASNARVSIPVYVGGPGFRILNLCDSVLEVRGASSVTTAVQDVHSRLNRG